MLKKDYLLEKLSEEEKAYLKLVIVNERKKYIRDNYNYINNRNIEFYDVIDEEAESIIDSVINHCEEEIKSAIELEKVVSNNKLYSAIKALSFKEKMVLFSLYVENKEMRYIAKEMKIGRTTLWRIKNSALDKIMKSLMGGNKNV